MPGRRGAPCPVVLELEPCKQARDGDGEPKADGKTPHPWGPVSAVPAQQAGLPKTPQSRPGGRAPPTRATVKVNHPGPPLAPPPPHGTWANRTARGAGGAPGAAKNPPRVIISAPSRASAPRRRRSPRAHSGRAVRAPLLAPVFAPLEPSLVPLPPPASRRRLHFRWPCWGLPQPTCHPTPRKRARPRPGSSLFPRRLRARAPPPPPASVGGVGGSGHRLPRGPGASRGSPSDRLTAWPPLLILGPVCPERSARGARRRRCAQRGAQRR